MNSNTTDRGCRALLRKLRAIDFAIQETVLYLDAYPHCSAAIDHYRKLVQQRKAAVEEYHRVCGPVTMYDNTGDAWDWISSPWPWQYEAN